MKRDFSDLIELMRRLRGPGGCPWDRKQTLEDLKPFVIEEAYEVVDAIDRGDRDALREEIGDLLLESVFLAQIAEEMGWFDVNDAVTAIYDKLVRRHPHVFGDAEAGTADQVLTNWEKLKNEERKAQDLSVLSGVPATLPALLKAARLTEKASRVGFDWERIDDVFAKLDEEIAELRAAVDSGRKEEIHDELGDLLFTVANIARKLEIPPEEALQSTNRKFKQRFEVIESTLRKQNRSFEETTLEEMDAMWNEAKGD
jgi:tetrapyrrole methylase family protein / MazG family protein